MKLNTSQLTCIDMAFVIRKPPILTTKLDAYPYQIESVMAVRSLPYSAIFHEQGLGKTKIAIDLALSWLDEDVVDTVFVITKKALVQNWVDEINVHSHITPRVLLSQNKRENNVALNSPVVLYVMNYEMIEVNFEIIKLFQKTCRVAAILDESQKIKNPDSNLTNCFHLLANGFVKRVIMTGTPVANRPFDLWSQIKFLDDGEALGQSFAEFKQKTDLPKDGSDREEYSAELSGIMNQIRPFSIRETKETSGIELPSKTILTHFVDMAPQQAKIYANYRNDMAHEFEGDNGKIKDSAESILKRLLRLVQCASNPILIDQSYEESPGKFSQLSVILEEIELKGQKTIVWTSFIESVNWLFSNLLPYNPVKVHSDLDIDVRNNALRRFKTDPSCRLLVATPGAAKEGLTLTVANHAVFYDRSFSLDDYLQAQDRIHRISQTDECFVHNLIAKTTIDEWIDRLLTAKHHAAQLAQGDIDQSEFADRFEFDLSDILQEILSPEIHDLPHQQL